MASTCTPGPARGPSRSGRPPAASRHCLRCSERSAAVGRSGRPRVPEAGGRTERGHAGELRRVTDLLLAAANGRRSRARRDFIHSFIKKEAKHIWETRPSGLGTGLYGPHRDPQPHRYSRQSSSSLLSEQSLSSSHAQTAGMHRSFRHWNWSLSHSFTAPTRHGAAPGSAGRASPPGESRGQGRSCNRHREPPAEGRGWGWARLGGCAPREHGGVRSCFVCAWKGRCRAPCTGLGAGDKGTQG